jgi:hypothetical protein
MLKLNLLEILNDRFFGMSGLDAGFESAVGRGEGATERTVPTIERKRRR